jgi:hypothetical protein
MFGKGGEGERFFKEALGRMEKEEVIELVRTIFADKELTVVEEWNVVGEVFKKWSQGREELRKVVPLEKRINSGDRKIDEEMDVIFGSEEEGK